MFPSSLGRHRTTGTRAGSALKDYPSRSDVLPDNFMRNIGKASDVGSVGLRALSNKYHVVVALFIPRRIGGLTSLNAFGSRAAAASLR